MKVLKPFNPYYLSIFADLYLKASQPLKDHLSNIEIKLNDNSFFLKAVDSTSKNSIMIFETKISSNIYFPLLLSYVIDSPAIKLENADAHYYYQLESLSIPEHDLNFIMTASSVHEIMNQGLFQPSPLATKEDSLSKYRRLNQERSKGRLAVLTGASWKKLEVLRDQLSENDLISLKKGELTLRIESIDYSDNPNDLWRVKFLNIEGSFECEDFGDCFYFDNKGYSLIIKDFPKQDKVIGDTHSKLSDLIDQYEKYKENAYRFSDIIIIKQILKDLYNLKGSL